MRAPLAAAFVVAMLLFAVPAFAQKNPTAAERSARDDMGTASQEEGRAEERRQDDRADREDDGEEDRRRSPTPIPIGEFDVDRVTGDAIGEYVNFTYDQRGLQGFTAAGQTLFNITPIDGTLPASSDIEVDGSRLKVEARGFKVVVHDNPTAASRIETNEPVTIEFTEGTTISPFGERHYAFNFGGLSGKIKGDNLVLNGTRVVAEGDILVVLDSARGALDEHRPDINDAIGRGHVGAEASFNKRGNDTESEVVSYANVTMTMVKAERGNLTVLIDGHGFDGRVLVLNVDGRVIGASQSEHLAIQFDNMTIARAASLTDALDPDDDGLQAEYYVVFDPALEAFQLIVSVPHYSVHTLSVGLVEFLPPPSVIFGVVFGVALLVPSAWALFRRK